MASDLFKECLADVYHGEQTGEIAFELMLHGAETVEQRYVLGSFLQLETEGKALLRPVLMRYGLSMTDHPDAKPNGAAGADGLSQLPWLDQFTALADMVKGTYLPRYEELATLISEEEDAQAFKVAAFMGDHERALIAASENIAAGKPDPMTPVVDLLTFPLLKPS